jgi:hypothetical protein
LRKIGNTNVRQSWEALAPAHFSLRRPFHCFLYSSSVSGLAWGVRRKEAELRNLRTSVSFRQFRAHRQMGHGHLSSHGLTDVWSSSRFRTAASQRAFSVGTRGRGGCFARRDKCPPGGCPRRHPAARRGERGLEADDDARLVNPAEGAFAGVRLDHEGGGRRG